MFPRVRKTPSPVNTPSNPIDIPKTKTNSKWKPSNAKSCHNTIQELLKNSNPDRLNNDLRYASEIYDNEHVWSNLSTSVTSGKQIQKYKEESRILLQHARKQLLHQDFLQQIGTNWDDKSISQFSD